MNKPKKTKILFIYDDIRTFIQKDLDILRKHFVVKTLKYTGKKDIPKLIFGVLTSDINLSWFALSYATMAVFFSKLFGKKSIVIAGGWDVVNMPEIGYGALLSDRNKKMIPFTLQKATKVIAVSTYTRKEALQCVDNVKIDVVMHGFDHLNFFPKGDKEKIAISVGGITSQTLKRKGLEAFVKSAAFLPEINFILVGAYKDESINYLKSIASPNVEFTGFISEKELISLFQKSKVYVQVSAHEGFGCSLAEAMLCECIPVVSNRGAIPEVVGDAGIYAEYDNPKDIANKIEQALRSDMEKNARKRIKDLFPINKRETELVNIINNIK